VETLKCYSQVRKELQSHVKLLSKSRFLPPETKDGCKIGLYANVDIVDELKTFHEQGGQGIGLFRSEYIFLSNDSFPSEEEQFGIYRRIAEQMQDLPVVIRTFDFGGDKLMLNHPVSLEGIPFLGCRAIRYLLKERDIFKSQIRAILRASVFGNLSIMFPMISTLSELLEAKEIFWEAREEVLKRGEQIAETIRIGCMVEVPSAAINADHLAKESDFLSIGTNDLIQYLLAVYRHKHSSSGYYASTDPSIIRMIRHVVKEGDSRGIPVTVCGEIAADPRFTSLLIGLGVKNFSVSSRYIPFVRRAIRNLTTDEATQLAEKVLQLNKAQDILELLHTEYQRLTPEDHFYI